MKSAVKQHPKTELFISTSFSYHPGRYTDKPTLMFCDWTYEYYLKHFLHKIPDFLERSAVKNEELLQTKVSAMAVLFPDVCRFIKDEGFSKNTFYLGNVINSSVYNPGEDVFNEKFNSTTIVFIGASKYLEGLVKLLEAVRLLRGKINLNVVVIGMSEDIISDELLKQNVTFMGYLDKTDTNQRASYYSVVDRAKIFVNTNPEWAAFSATLDVMYHLTPVITSKYRSFLETFGTKIKFGYYSENDPQKIAKKIERIFDLDHTEYKLLCQESRSAVEPFTWKNYARKLVKVLEDSEVIDWD